MGVSLLAGGLRRHITAPSPPCRTQQTGGSIGSFLGPLAVGLLADGSPGFGGAMLLMSAVCALGGCLALAFRGGGGGNSGGNGGGGAGAAYQRVEQQLSMR